MTELIEDLDFVTDSLSSYELRKLSDILLKKADVIDSNNCTGIAASWCPLHGDCVCPYPEDEKSSFDCPLHSPISTHADIL